MSFCSSASGRACLNEWDRPLAVTDILDFLFALKRAVASAKAPIVLIVVVRERVPVPPNFLLTCIQSALPAILDCCELLLLVVEGAGVERASLRSAFRLPRHAAARRTPTLLCESLSTAFAQAQRYAPHDVIELQRRALHQSFPPNGQRT